MGRGLRSSHGSCHCFLLLLFLLTHLLADRLHVLRQADQILELWVLVQVILLTSSNRGDSIILKTHRV